MAKKAKKAEFKISLKGLLKAGCHFGHQSRRWNPKMTDYIYAKREGVHIFDLGITAQKLAEAMEEVRTLVSEGKEIVLVGTKRQAASIIKEEAIKVKAPFVSVRWLGGAITNWEQIEKSLKKLIEMEEKKKKGEYKKYTKKENVLIDREIDRLDRFFGGLRQLKQVPEAIFVVDIKKEIAAVKEARLRGIKVIAMVDTNSDPDLVDFLIPANDDAVRSIKFVVSQITKAYAQGKALAVRKSQAKQGKIKTSKKQTPTKNKK